MNILPTTKFLSNTPAEQLMHMAEELGEIAKALREGDTQHAKEEAADLQLSAETFIAILHGNGEEERLYAIEKNMKRDYYKGAKKMALTGDVIANKNGKGDNK